MALRDYHENVSRRLRASDGLVPWAPRPYLPKPLTVAQIIQRRLADAPTPPTRPIFDALLSSRAVGNINFANHSRWADAATDALLEQFRADPTEARRAEIERVIAEEVPLLPLVYGQSCVVHGRHVRNVTLEPTGSLSLAGFTVT